MVTIANRWSRRVALDGRDFAEDSCHLNTIRKCTRRQCSLLVPSASNLQQYPQPVPSANVLRQCLSASRFRSERLTGCSWRAATGWLTDRERKSEIKYRLSKNKSETKCKRSVKAGKRVHFADCLLPDASR